MYTKLLFSSTLILAAPLAHAQDEWDWSVTPYLWATAIDGDVGLGPIRTEVDIDFDELLNVLSGALLLHAEAQRGNHGYFGDLIYMSVEPDPKTGPLGGQIQSELQATIVELGYLYDAQRLGLEFGIRYWDFDLELWPAILPAVQGQEDWVDGFVGIRSERELNDKWNMTIRANLGAGGADLTYGVGLVFGRELTSGSQFMAGVKLLDIDYEDTATNGRPITLDQTLLGATIGYMFD
jgi:hypothetical protein